MASNSILLFALAWGLLAVMPVTACDRGPTRIATGEEIAAAVENAEVQMMQARATANRASATALTLEGG